MQSGKKALTKIFRKHHWSAGDVLASSTSALKKGLLITQEENKQYQGLFYGLLTPIDPTIPLSTETTLFSLNVWNLMGFEFEVAFFKGDVLDISFYKNNKQIDSIYYDLCDGNYHERAKAFNSSAWDLIPTNNFDFLVIKLLQVGHVREKALIHYMSFQKSPRESWEKELKSTQECLSCMPRNLLNYVDCFFSHKDLLNHYEKHSTLSDIQKIEKLSFTSFYDIDDLNFLKKQARSKTYSSWSQKFQEHLLWKKNTMEKIENSLNKWVRNYEEFKALSPFKESL